MKNLAVIGSSGMLGYAVSSYFSHKGYNVKGISRKDYDIVQDPLDKLERLLDGCEVVINCAGVIKPTITKNTVEDILKINAIFPRNLAKLCNKKNIKCFHITTDCVYSGKKGNYTEEDYFDAEDLYGLSKNAGETSDCMVIRTSIIGEENGNSRSLLEWAKSQAGKEVNGFINHWWNGVTTLYLAEIIEKILLNNLYQKGIYHIYSQNYVNKYELLGIFNEIYKLKMKINPISAEVAINRCLSSIYDLSNIVSIKQIKQQINEMKEFFENQKTSVKI